MVDKPKTPTRTGDQETDEILEEMSGEGWETPEPENASDKKTEGSQDKSETESESEESESEEDNEPEEEETEEEETEDEESEEESDVEDEAEDEKPKMSPSSWKIARGQKKLEKAIGSILEEIKSIKESKQSPVEKQEDVDAEIEKFAEEHNLDPKVAKGLIDLAAKRSQLDPAVSETIKEIKERDQEERYWESQDSSFDDEFNRGVIPVLERDHPDITQEQVDEIYDKLYDLAWDPKTAKKSLIQLYLGDKSLQPKSKDRRTGESYQGTKMPRGGAEDTNYDNVTAEDITNMSDEEFDKYSEKMAKDQRSALQKAMIR